MDSPIQEIKEKLDLVDVISGYIKLSKTGANYRAVCPFHSEKKPSFFVSPTRQLWRCFGCGKNGDAFSFIQEIEGIEFGDALRLLAQKAGVKLQRQDPQVQTQRKRFYEILETSTKFYEQQLHEGKNGQKAKQYLLNRKITEESIKKWQIGFAPASWNSLGDFLQKKGFSVGEIKRAGLLLESKNGKVYDRFRARIIFPIFDLNSQVVGFGGRFFGSLKQEGEEPAKYLNLPNTLLYNKSNILYGLDKAKVAIRKEDNCILVEGYTDVILSDQAGVNNVVSTSGTALTPQQLTILKRYSNNLITAFDMDVAGDSATKRGIDLAQAHGFDIRIAMLPEGKDPADVVMDAPEQWKKFIKESRSILDFYFEKAFLSFDKSKIEDKKKISSTLLPIVAKIQNKIEQSHWTKELAKQLDVTEHSVEQELSKYTNLSTETEPGEEKFKTEKKNRKDLIEERIISLLLNFPERINLVNDEAVACFSEVLRGIIKEFKKDSKEFWKNYQEIDTDDNTKELLNELALTGEAEKLIREVDDEEEIIVSLEELSQIFKKERLQKLSEEIKQAEAGKESSKVKELSKEFNELAKSLL
ncbi:DNA primase [Patescibacteria group bacterium]|nr:DNA primase [Patescibacteria group bacterium]MBU4078493.1 DNA primase [Patescibacteria group bacterium]